MFFNRCNYTIKFGYNLCLVNIGLFLKVKLLCLFILVCFCNANSQTKKEERQARKKAKLEKLDSLTNAVLQNKPMPNIESYISLNTGTTWIEGDVSHISISKKLPGTHLGLIFETKYDNVFSLSFGGNYAVCRGYDYQFSNINIQATNLNRAIVGSNYYTETFNLASNKTPNYLFGENNLMYNYKSKFYEFFVQGIFHLNFGNKISLDFKTGIGYLNYVTKMNLLDDNLEEYNFSETIDATDKSEIENQILNLLDDNFESQAELYDNKNNSARTSSYPIYVGNGLTYKLTYKLNLNVNYVLAFLKDDLIDGQQRNKEGNLSGDNDRISKISLQIAYRLK